MKITSISGTYNMNGQESTLDNNCCSSSKRSLAQWHEPINEKRGQLRLLNSLTRKKEVFTPRDGNKVTWYICGPTVYDAAHMGHARSYISFDILRRVLQSYFGYDVLFVMNITDIDDKIIKRARQRYLMEEYSRKDIEKELSIQKVISDVLAAVVFFKERYERETNEEKKVMLEGLLSKVERSVSDLENVLRNTKMDKIDQARRRLLDDARDVLADWLDAKSGASINDHSIFESLAREFEADFHGDMARLNVAPPDVVTRVSEYVPEIVSFIERIIRNGYAYESNGSVYFDTVAFDKNPKHHYAKLVPEAYDAEGAQMSNALREAEGELCNVKQQDKRNCNDFALWKKSAAGEPSWPSPWGPGRPGWHIECSVMATEICGETLDIHGGGFDLKFPHHDNELAQTEAYFGNDQWVNYFLHAGMLRIAGLKMSKSLKNFVTIKDALRQYTARQIRLLFLLQNWSDVLDYSASTMEAALKFEKLCNEFFLSTKFYVNERFDKKRSSSFAKFEKEELELNAQLSTARQRVHEALCDSLDTRTALDALRDLISSANVYINGRNAARRQPNILLLRNVSLYVTRLMRVFGVVTMAADDEAIGFGIEPAIASLTENGNMVNGVNGVAHAAGDKEQLVMPYVKALTNFRQHVRSVAIDAKLSSILDECDRLRNEVLPALGVRLEDREEHTMVKMCDPEELLREKQQEAEQRAKILAEKERKRAEQEAREARRRVPPAQLFRVGEHAGRYTQFDADGVPTHDASGAELSKGARKKLEKVYAVHKQRFVESQ